MPPINLARRKSTDGFDHRVGVAPARIIALPDAASTIAMLLPEGNCGVVFGCCFENYFIDASLCEARFGSFQQARADFVPAISLEHVDGDDVSTSFAICSETEAGRFAANGGDQAIRVREAEVSAKFRARISDSRGVAGLVNFVERFEVFRRVWPQRDFGSLACWFRRGHSDHTSRITGRIRGRFEVCLFR